MHAKLTSILNNPHIPPPGSTISDCYTRAALRQSEHKINNFHYSQTLNIENSSVCFNRKVKLCTIFNVDTYSLVYIISCKL